jgi:hypothetical protein
MTRPTAIVLSAVLLARGAAAAPGVTFYVSPAGRDTWSGGLDAPDPGGAEGPFASVTRALDAVRAARQRGYREAVRVLIREGTYHLTAPLTMGPEHSGTADGPTVLAAFPGERPLLSGGTPIRDLRESSAGGWESTLPEVKAGTWHFRQLWVNGKRRSRPRLPAQGTYALAGGGDPPAAAFLYRPGHLQPDWRNRGDLEVVVLQYWTEARLRIAALDDAAHRVSFTGGSWRPLTWSMGYYVENVAEALAAAGQWYLDRPTGLLRYLPEVGESIPNAQVVAPVLEQLLRLEGTPERPIHYVELRGLRFGHCAWPLPGAGLAYPQAELPVGAAIAATYARDCLVADCEVSHCDTWGLELGRGCQDNQILRCRFEDLGAGGVKVGEPEVCAQDADEACRTTLRDCTFREGAQSYFGGPAVWLGQSSGNTVNHNEISGSWQWAVSAGWNWGYGRSRAHDNRIEYNHAHHLGSALGSHSTIYTLGIQPGTIIRRNLVHHCAGYGIGLDQATTGVRVEENVVHHNAAGLHFNWDCLGNVVTNNIFALNGPAQWTRYGDAPRYDDTNCNVLQRNIVCWDKGRLWVEPKWPNYRMVLNHNLYFDYSGAPVTFLGVGLDEWRTRGQWLDQESVVADPLFVAPENGDFRLRPGSPAIRLGFVPFDVDEAGPGTETGGNDPRQ